MYIPKIKRLNCINELKNVIATMVLAHPGTLVPIAMTLNAINAPNPMDRRNAKVQTAAAK
jgi:hypothetical protein